LYIFSCFKLFSIVVLLDVFGNSKKYFASFTDSVDQNTGQDEIKDVEHRSSPQLDEEGDVGERVCAAGIVDITFFGAKRFQLEFAVFLVVSHVPFAAVRRKKIKLKKKFIFLLMID
jgi:hypothetical protein